MKKWEHKRVCIAHTFSPIAGPPVISEREKEQEVLDKYAMEGWELCGVDRTETHQYRVFYFKRELVEHVDPITINQHPSKSPTESESV